MNASNNKLQVPTVDIVFVESSHRDPHPFERSIVGMRGKFTLDSWRDAEGTRREFDCRVLKLSTKFIELAAIVTGMIGEWAIVHLDSFGKFEGPVIRTAARNVVVKIVATGEERLKLASKIAWVENKVPDARRHHRIPSNAHSILLMSDRSEAPCQIIDYSVSGAAIFTELKLEIGAIIKVGKIIARVVRLFPGGNAVEFAVLQDIRSVEKLIIPPAKVFESEQAK